MKVLAFITFLMAATLGMAQEVLLPLEINERLQELSRNQATARTKAVDTIIIVSPSKSKIILLDDFSSDFGWPKDKYWADDEVYINTHWGLNPRSLGVATFDGLDATGYPYNFVNPKEVGENDHLTSLPMTLDSIFIPDGHDTVFLSFWYQPQGMNPFETQEDDSLYLEFYNPALDRWEHQWSARGVEVNDFRQAIVMVPPNLYQRGFKFRFVNRGNRAGSVDHWHIDYVYMASDLRKNFNDIEDVAFRMPTTSLIEGFTAMPWYHYVQSPASYMRSNLGIRFRNNKSTEVEFESQYQTLDAKGNVVSEFMPGPGTPQGNTVKPRTSGFDVIPNADNSMDFTFPTNVAPADSTTFFTRKSYYNFTRIVGDDLIPENDTLFDRQVFSTYYAYDDGSAEAGYGLGGSGNSLAIEFNLRPGLSDTLKGIYIHFNPIIHNRSNEKFRLVLWDADNQGEPGDVIYTNERIDRPEYPRFGGNSFVRYDFEDPIIVSGKFFVGWTKLTTDPMNVGYDVNTDRQERIYINVGGGWKQSGTTSNIPAGALMVRAIFRSNIDHILSTEDLPLSATPELYPNPVNGNEVRVKGLGDQTYTATLFNLQGQQLSTLMNVRNNDPIDVANLPEGLYVLQLVNTDSGEGHNFKLVVSH